MSNCLNFGPGVQTEGTLPFKLCLTFQDQELLKYK